MIKLLLGLLMASFSLIIQAQTSCWLFPSFPDAITPQPTASQACTALASARGGTNPVWYPDFNQCTFINSSGVSVDYNPVQAPCSLCSAGLLSRQNVTLGYSSGGLNAPIDHPVPDGSGASVCISSCLYPIKVPLDVTSYWVSAAPTPNGLYRHSADVMYVSNGQTCSASATAPNSSTAPPPPCSGTQGTVNGVPVCLPASTSPTSTSSIPSLSTSTVPTSTGNPPAGTSTGVTPGTGNGGPSGGPGTATGSSGGSSGSTAGTGTTNIDLQVETCGLPGKPACKLNEDGTPSGENFGKAEKDAINSKFDELQSIRDGISSTSGKDTSWALPSWVASGSCQPYHLGNLGNYASLTLDLCPHVPIFNGVMTLFWIVLGFVGILGMVFRATTGAK